VRAGRRVLKQISALILAGGRDRDLGVLCKHRATTALPFGGRYRVIDFCLSNLVNSGVTTAWMLTQYAPASLIDHIGIGRPWDLDRREGGVLFLQPYVRRGSQGWYAGTADALVQNLSVIEESQAKTILVLSGDSVCKMDYSRVLAFHRSREAAVTVAVTQVPAAERRRFGIVTADPDGRAVSIQEKPDDASGHLAFMGVYAFDCEFLVNRLKRGDNPVNLLLDVVIPELPAGRVYAYLFRDYWEDIGHVMALYRANRELLSAKPRLDLFDRSWIIYTKSEEAPPVQFSAGAEVRGSLLANGCRVAGTVVDSILFPGVTVEPGAVVRDSILFPGVTVGRGARMDRVIADKEVHVGAEARVGEGEGLVANRELPALQEGLTIIGKNALIPAKLIVGRHCQIDTDVEESDFSGKQLADGTTLLRRGPARV
jgi:glucose-1-phosphate adenylyltransferase